MSDNIATGIICEHCGALITSKPQKTFLLGFQNYTCAACGKKTLYPLTDAYVLIYCLVIAFSVLGFLAALAEGNFVIPSLLLIGAVIALVKHHSLRKKRGL